MSSEDFTEEDEHLFFLMSIHNPVLNDYRIGYITISVILSIMMTLGNAFVLLLFYQERRNLKIAHRFIISMAVSDFINGAIYIPIMIYKYLAEITSDSIICPKIASILIAIYQTALFVITTASIDRFWAVVFPVHYRNNMTYKVANVMILVSWIIPWTFGLTHLFTYLTPPKKDLVCLLCALIITKPLLIILMSSIAVNLLTMIILYIFIQRAIIKVLRRKGTDGVFTQAYKILLRRTELRNRNETENHPPMKTREVRSTLIVLMIIVVALITYLPSTVNIIIMTLNPGAFDMGVKLVIYLFLNINSIFNPILYTFNIKNIRMAAKRLILRVTACKTITDDRNSIELTSITNVHSH